ncbi:MAG: DUF4388 domain-containing protein [Acidobacteriia bacterium]|nr:DUF4388 domain-containing protein [Terriglobia bacterium]
MLTISGTLDRLYLGDLLEWLHLTHATGRLLLTTGDVTREFDLYCGRVAFASSSYASERLGSWLLYRGVASREALLRALVLSQTRGELFTVVLERQAGIAHETLVEAGRALATALVSRVLHQDQVFFTFDPTRSVADRKHVDLEMDCRNLIMQAAYRADTHPPSERSSAAPNATLDSKTIEALFWHIVGELQGELVDPGALAEAHRTFLAVGDLLNRWVVQGSPLLPIGPDDAERVERRLKSGKSVRLEDSPTLAWNLLSLVNGLSVPGVASAAGADEAWQLAGADAAVWVRLILENPRWRRESRSETDAAIRRATLSRIAAARRLASVVDLSDDVATTSGALAIVILELVATGLGTSAMAGPALQRCAIRHLLPLVGQAAGLAAGMPEVLLAALSLTPAHHQGARLSRLVGLAAGELITPEETEEEPALAADPAVKTALASARRAAERAARPRREQR